MKSEEIAKLAGVSRSTVSRVLNNYPNVPETTRQKVMKVIEQYHYEPNTSARVLAGKGTNTIGLFIISISDKDNPNRIYQNNYFAPFVDAVLDKANAEGYYVLVHTVYKKQDYIKIKQAFSQKRIDGGIIVGTEKDNDFLCQIINMNRPVAVVDYDLNEIVDSENLCSNLVVINSTDYEGAKNAIEYLIHLGHRDIGIIKGRLTTYSGRERFRAYQDTLKKHHIPVNESFVLKGEFIKKIAYAQVEKMVESGDLPTALFCCNDDMALAAMEVFEAKGIKVPQDISIIGFDDIPIASQLIPGLTTVKVPVYNMARKAVESVIRLYEKGTCSEKECRFNTELIVRDTCRKFS